MPPGLWKSLEQAELIREGWGKEATLNTFKTLAELTRPDVRSAGIGFYGSPPSLRPKTLEDHHAEAAAQALHAGVPSDVAEQFDTARNLYLYTWFSYPLVHVAELHALGTVEFGLRVRFAPASKRRYLGPLLRLALTKQLVRDDQMRMWQRRKLAREQQQTEEDQWSEDIRRLFAHPQPEPASQDPQSFVRHLPSRLHKYRNLLAHGGIYLHPRGAIVLELCCDLLNQIFAGAAFADEPSSDRPCSSRRS